MAVTEEVVALLKAEGQRAFTATMHTAAGSVSDVGQSQVDANKQMKRSIGGFVSAAAVVGGMVKGYSMLKGAINTTVDLAKSTAGFARASGMDMATAQNWTVVAQQRGIATKQMQLAMTTLGRNLGALGAPSKASAAAFQQLGLSQKALMALPMDQRLNQISDAFAAMPDGAQKAALAQRLFGKSGQSLLPILNKGSGALQEQLQAAQDLVPVTAESSAAALELAKQQRDMSTATLGLKVAVGSVAIPLLTQLTTVFTPLVSGFAKLLANSEAFRTAIVVLVPALLTFMAVLKIMTVVQTAFGLSLALSVGWIALIAAGIIALVAVFVILYTKVGWFHNAVQAVFGWIKSNWPLLLAILMGPVGLAIAWIIKNFDKVKAAARDTARVIGSVLSAVWTVVKTAVVSAVNFIRDRIQELVRIARTVADGIKKAFEPVKDVVGAVGSAVSSAGDVGGSIVGAVTGRAGGGMVQPGELTLVGERGPEVAQYPAGTVISPLPALAPAQTTAHFYLDRRLVMSAVARADADDRARR